MTKIAQSSYDINSNGGLIYINELIEGLGTQICEFDALGKKNKSNNKGVFKNSDIIKTALALLSMGEPNFEDLNMHSYDTLLLKVLGKNKMFSSATYRQRMDKIGYNLEIRTLIDQLNVALLKKVKDFGTIHVNGVEYVPIDIDVSVCNNENSNKENVQWTYKEVEGFAPIFATIGSVGYQLANEMRPGSQHSAKDANAFVTRVIKLARNVTNLPLLIRMDSAHHNISMRKTLMDNNVDYIIKRSYTSKNFDDVLSWYAKSSKEHREETIYPLGRSTDDIYIKGTVRNHKTNHLNPVNVKESFIFRYMFRYRKDELKILPVEEINCYWSSLLISYSECKAIYKARGTSEQFHSELKTDMDIEKFPSGKYDTNQLILALASISFNMLRVIGQTFLESRLEQENKPKCHMEKKYKSFKHKASKYKRPGYKKRRTPRVNLPIKRLRLRTVLLRIIHVGVHICNHAREQIVKFGKCCKHYDKFKLTYDKIKAL